MYQQDPDFTVGYRSWDAFAAENVERLPGYLPFAKRSNCHEYWAFFGNSFVQAPGMLADRARERLPERTIFNLGKNEPLCLRFSQIKLLLDHGLPAERIFFLLMPVDVVGLGRQPLATQHVTARGALTYEPAHQAGVGGFLARHSRLGLAAAIRSGQQIGNPEFRNDRLYEGIQEPLLGDLRFLFGNLARTARAHHVPVTVMLIPAYHQIRFGASCGFQDALKPFLLEQGYDVFDPREAFRKQADRDGLFIPDKHFSPRGNEILLNELLRHLEQQEITRRRDIEPR
jgi:hypothetical protein